MTKLTLRYGDISIEYDGPEEFLKEQLTGIVEAVSKLKGLAPPAKPTDAKREPSTPPGQAKISVSTIAHKLGVKSEPELIAAAAYSLALDGTPAFKKKALRDRTREVKTLWKKSYGNNFDNYVNRLVSGGRLNHVGGDEYAIPQTEQTSMSSRLSSAA